jgi:hypothetical protein
MARTVDEPLIDGIDPERRKRLQEEFGRHLVEHRNYMAALVRQWIEADKRYPVPMYDRLLERVRHLDHATRADVASIALLMADQIVSAVLATFARGDEMRVNADLVNYVIIAQIRRRESDEVVEEVDVNRGEPLV